MKVQTGPCLQTAVNKTEDIREHQADAVSKKRQSLWDCKQLHMLDFVAGLLTVNEEITQDRR